MEYIGICFSGLLPEDYELLPAFLAELGFDSFSEEDELLNAFIPADQFSETELRQLLDRSFSGKSIAYAVSQHADQNWNAVWESNFEPVVIENICRVRAPFHDPDPSMPYEILIEPKMSFGTAHHETTYMMIHHLLDLDLQGKEVMDMGCGTAVLAILAAMKGARNIMAIDNEEWAYRNALENVENNGFPDIRVMHGDADNLPDRTFDVFIANINRNILLRDMPRYVKCIKDKGLLILSGFYTEDVEAINEAARKLNLFPERYLERNRWTAGIYRLNP